MNIIINPLQEAKFYSNRILNQSSINNAGNTDKNSNTRSVNNGIYPAAENYAHILNQVSFKRGLSSKIKNNLNYCNYCSGNVYTKEELAKKAENLIVLKSKNLLKQLDIIINEIEQSEKEANTLLTEKNSRNSEQINFFKELKQLSFNHIAATCSELVKIADSKIETDEQAKALIFKNLNPLLKTGDHTIARYLLKNVEDIDLLLVEACHTCNTIKGNMSFNNFALRYPEIQDYMPEEKYEIAIKIVSKGSKRKLKTILKDNKLSEQQKADEIKKLAKTANDNPAEYLTKQEKKNTKVPQKKIEDLPDLLEKKEVLLKQIQEQEIILTNLNRKFRVLLEDRDFYYLKASSDNKKEIEKTENQINSYNDELKRKPALERKYKYLQDHKPEEKDKKQHDKNKNKAKSTLQTLMKYEKLIPKLNRKLSKLKYKQEYYKYYFKNPDELRAEIRALNEILNEEKIINEKLLKIKEIDDKNAQIHTKAKSLMETLNKTADQITLQANYDDQKISGTTAEIDTFVRSLKDKDIKIEECEPVELDKMLANFEEALGNRRKNLSEQIASAKRHMTYLKVLNGNILTLKDSLKTNGSNKARIAATESEQKALQKRLEELQAHPPDREKLTAEVEKLTEKLTSLNSKLLKLENVEKEIAKTQNTINSRTKDLNTVESDIYSINQIIKSQST